MIVYVQACDVCVALCAAVVCGGGRTTWWNQLFPSVFLCVLEPELRSPRPVPQTPLSTETLADPYFIFLILEKECFSSGH